MLKFVKRLWNGDIEALPRRARISIPTDRVSDIFAIGDIHGCLDLLLAAEQRIFDRMVGSTTPALVVCLGDYVDRGPDSRGVIEHLRIQMQRPFYRISVCGNHDDLFFNFIRGERFDRGWLDRLGGISTLASYGIDARHLLSLDPHGQRLKEAVATHVPDAHLAFLESLPVAVSIGNYLFVHAGIAPGRPLDDQTDAELMWMREPFLTEGPRLGLTVIHGHTPSASVQYGPDRIGIDTGAYATGKLSVIHIGRHGVEEI
jgi:serine/threonine protein phosphatase 1